MLISLKGESMKMSTVDSHVLCLYNVLCFLLICDLVVRLCYKVGTYLHSSHSSLVCERFCINGVERNYCIKQEYFEK